MSAEEVSPKPSDNVPLAEEPVNGCETDEHSVDGDLFKPPTTPPDFYEVGGPPADNGSDAGHDSADDIWGPETEDNVNEPEAPVEELDGIQGNDGNIARNIVKLATFCGLSAKELTKLMSEEPFTTMFQLINEKVFEPARQQAIRTMKPRPRMMDLKTVVAGLDAGESHGNQRYSNPQPGEQDRWSDLDHHANFLHQMRTQFYKRRGGFLFGRSLNDDEANQRIWLILKRADANLAPSRQKRQAEKAKRQLRGLENDTPGRSRTKAASNRSKDVVGKASGKAALDNDPMLDSIVDSVNDGDNADDESDVEVLVEDMAVDDNTFRATAEDPAYVSGQMRAELPDDDVSTPNYSYRYWQYHHMRALTINYHSAVEAAERINTNIAADKLNDIGLEEGLATAQADEDQEADDVDTDIVCMGEATPTELVNAERLSRLLSNSKYQRDNLKQSLNALRIQDRRFPRLPGQSLGCPLRWWQIVGANAIATARRQRKMRGMILADIVGLGKTFQVAAYMLHVSYRSPSFIMCLPGNFQEGFLKIPLVNFVLVHYRTGKKA